MVVAVNLIADKHQGDREEQQDAYFVAISHDQQRILCVVADGMGGHQGGKKASACVVTAAKNQWQQTAEGAHQEPQQLLESILQQAYDMMLACEKKENISPRSTCVMLLITEHGNKKKAHYCHLGDSRLYHFRQDKLLTRTKDHSVVQMLVEMGEVSEASMGTHESQGHLLKWLGGKEPPEATCTSVDVEANDQFLLCTDGLWEYVSTEQMEQAWQSQRHSPVNIHDTQQIAQQFIQQARRKSHGKGDNIALVLYRAPENANTRMIKKHFLGLGLIAMIALLSVIYYINA